MLPHVCGSNSDHPPMDECWRFVAPSNSWEKASGSLPRDINRVGHAFQEDWGIIMAGGRKNDGECCSYNVTFTTTATTFENLMEPLPESNVYFCVTGINASHIFITGLGAFDKDTYMYSTLTNEWQQLPLMPTGRRYSGCGVVRLEDGSKVVVVVGGYGYEVDNDRTDTVEIYSIEEQQWHTGLVTFLTTVNYNSIYKRDKCFSQQIPNCDFFHVCGASKKLSLYCWWMGWQY